MRRKLPEYFHLQPIGQRIIKTAVAVTICLLFYMLRGYEGSTMPAEAAITAIICMNTNVRGTRANALSRFFGTLIGAFWGFLFLVIVPQFPAITEKRWALYLLMGLGTLLALYSAVIIKKPEIAGLAAIVFVCVVVIYRAERSTAQILSERNWNRPWSGIGRPSIFECSRQPYPDKPASHIREKDRRGSAFLLQYV